MWVDAPGVAEREMAGRLCRRHANALVVPRGWTVDDRRNPVRTLFRVDDPGVVGPVEAGTDRTKRARRARTTGIDTPSLFESIRRDIEAAEVARTPADAPANAAAETDAGAAVDPDETQAIPWSPRLGKGSITDDGSARPRFGRLLGRAFGDAVDESWVGEDG